MARQLKDEGNFEFKQKSYQAAISKWCKVQLFTKQFLPKTADADQMMSMINKQTVPEEVQQDMLELQASTNLNMAVAFYMIKKYDKSIKKATESLALKKSIKAYYRRGKAYAELE